MLPFLHDRSQKLQQLIARSSDTLAKYNRFDLDLATALTAFIDEAIDAYRTFSRSDVENELVALKAQYVSAQRGTNPLTLERLTSHRRDMERAIALRVLQQSAQRLRSDFEQTQKALAECRAQLHPIVLQAIHKALIPSRWLQRQSKPTSPQQFDTLWRTLLNDPDMQLAARQVAMQINLIDIQLVVGDLIAAAKSATPLRRRKKSEIFE